MEGGDLSVVLLGRRGGGEVVVGVVFFWGLWDYIGVRLVLILRVGGGVFRLIY